jgi:hypothetical protein
VVLHVDPREHAVFVGGLDDGFEVLREHVVADVQTDLGGFHRDAGVHAAPVDAPNQVLVRSGVLVGGRALVVVLAEQVQNSVDAPLVQLLDVLQGLRRRLSSDEPARDGRNHT